MRFQKNFLVLVLVSGLISCSKLKDVSDNAKKATENSGRAADAAQASREEIANGRLMSRSGSASTSRREALKALKEWDSFEMKVTEGSKFVKALEFQTWTGQKYDDPEYLESLRVDGLREFFRATYELNNEREITIDQLSPIQIWGKQKKRTSNVLALAIAMHGIHNYQEHVSSEKSKELDTAISLYELLKRSLREVRKVEIGDLGYDDLKPHQQIVYEYKNVAIAIIQARMNMFLTMNLAKTTDLLTKSVTVGIEKILNVNFKRSKLKFHFLDQHLGEQNKANKYVDGARKVKFFLDEIGEDSTLLYDVRRLYAKIELPNLQDPTNIPYDNSEEEKEFLEYLKGLDNFFDRSSGRFEDKN